ncbi:MAG: hypothetical protein JNL21_25900 [Myxococcales bacterium]|nr:hypothetical protein [Myxococcales bacterium]
MTQGAPRARSEYRYTLDRRARLRSHLHVWRGQAVFMPLAIFVGVALIVVTRAPAWTWIGPGALAFLSRGFFIGLVQILLVARQSVVLVLDKRGIGFGEKAADFWIFADGILTFEKSSAEVWTLHHFNGTVITVPTAVISDEDAQYLREHADKRQLA